MYLNQVPRFIKVCQKAGHVPFLWGEAGIGKSQVVYQTADEIIKETKTPFEIIELRLGQMEVGDLIGLPRNEKNEAGETVMVWSIPEWWPTPNAELYKKTGKAKYAPNGFVFLDEFNRATTNDVIQAMFQFILGKRNSTTGKIERFMHTHKLPEGWFPVCAGNPESGEYVVQTLDTAMLNRFIQVVVKKNHKQTINWMKNNLKNDELWKFVATSPNTIGASEKVTLVVKPKARSYEYIDGLMGAMSEEDMNEFGLEVLEGCLGEEVGKALYLHLKNNLLKPIPAEKILNTKDFSKLFESDIAKYLDGDKKRLELINATLDDLARNILEKGPTKKQASNVLSFLDLVPPDMALKFIEEILQCKNDEAKNVIYMMAEENKESLMKKLIMSLGYSEETINEAVAQLEKIAAEIEAELAKGKTDVKS